MEKVKSGEFYAQLEAHFSKRLSPQEANDRLKFAREIFARFPFEEMEGELVVDVAGSINTTLEFFSHFQGDKPKISIYNPSLEEHGWEHRYTQILILQKDMAFLVDSIMMAVGGRGYGIHDVGSTLFNVRRDTDGGLQEILADDSGNGSREALIFLRIDKCSSEDELASLEDALHALLSDVRIVTEDFQPSLARLDGIIAGLEENPAQLPDDKRHENLRFLRWLKQNHFTFLGYACYELVDQGEPCLHHLEEQQLGLFRAHPQSRVDQPLSSLAHGFSDFYGSDQQIVLTKSARRAHIHRDAYCDYIIIKRVNKSAQVIGEHRFLGLYTSPVYTESPFSIPLVREKLNQVYTRSGLTPSGHDGKNLRQIIETFPREELFHASEDQLYVILMGVWQIKERRQVKLFIRPDIYEKFVSCVVYFPRDIYHTDIRLKTEKFLMEELDASASQFTTHFGESALARTHFVFRINSDRYKQLDYKFLEQRIIQFTRNWSDDLEQVLLEHWGDEIGRQWFRRFKAAFPASYQEHFDPRTALHDLQLSMELSAEDQIGMIFYHPPGVSGATVKFKILHLKNALQLSDLVPMLEYLGFRVIGEHPFEIRPLEGPSIWAQEFTLQLSLAVSIDVSQVRQTFQDAFEAVWLGLVDNDTYNNLVVGARLDWQSVALLRLYGRYIKQLGLSISQEFIAGTLVAYPDITRNLVALFKSYFDPKLAGSDGKRMERCKRLEQKIHQSLEAVSNLNEDQVLRSYLQLVSGTLRTSFFQKDREGRPKPWIAVKLASRSLDIVPEPRPEFEIFVYSPRMEAVHLRTGKIARGGLRWSDRLEDYRTEILGLVKAQQVKNAIIVPTGAKGGFVAKKIPAGASIEQKMEEGIACYRMFIAAMLDLTDNRREGKITTPENLIRRDDEDFYHVVAADKGTAKFSDIANEVSASYGFWLGDAFASGGSFGYDHKKMGITARGAWVAVENHFWMLGLNTRQQAFTVVGIGDMSGDVFGNGMLLSPHIRLVAAFNHEAVFLDPNPNPVASFAERKRLFALPRSGWNDYNPELISSGGGVFPRRIKAIPISEEVKAALGISEDSLAPSQVIKAMLKSPVDLIWNGGIGTYVKGSLETNYEVGDRVNDEVRVNGKELNCKVFCEGGNLGITQLGRIEYCINGGACNTDFIDNAGGVSCSDLEVNLKIFLNQLVENQDLTVKQRNALLEQMTDNVAEMVLKRNFRQVQGITLAQFQSRKNGSQFWNLLQDWEQAGYINRSLEFFPSEEETHDRRKGGISLTRPELSLLVSHAKMIIKEALPGADILDDSYLETSLFQAFPSLLDEQYRQQLPTHPLKYEIIANQIANEMVDLMGPSFVHRQIKSTGAGFGDVVRAYLIAREILGFDQAWEEIENIGYHLEADKQLHLLTILMRLGRRITRWVLRNRLACKNVQAEVDSFQAQVRKLLHDTNPGWPDDQALIELCDEARLSRQTTALIVGAERAFFILGVVDVSIRTALPLELVEIACGKLQEQLSIRWVAEQIIDLQVTSRWEDFAREAFMDELEHQFRALLATITQEARSQAELQDRLDNWEEGKRPLIERWQATLQDLASNQEHDFAMFSVLLRELLNLVNSSAYSDRFGSICSIDNPAAQ